MDEQTDMTKLIAFSSFANAQQNLATDTNLQHSHYNVTSRTSRCAGCNGQQQRTLLCWFCLQFLNRSLFFLIKTSFLQSLKNSEKNRSCTALLRRINLQVNVTQYEDWVVRKWKIGLYKAVYLITKIINFKTVMKAVNQKKLRKRVANWQLSVHKFAAIFTPRHGQLSQTTYINDKGGRKIISRFLSPNPTARGWCIWAIGGKEGSVSAVGKHAAVFRIEIVYKILNCVH